MKVIFCVQKNSFTGAEKNVWAYNIESRHQGTYLKSKSRVRFGIDDVTGDIITVDFPTSTL